MSADSHANNLRSAEKRLEEHFEHHLEHWDIQARLSIMKDTLPYITDAASYIDQQNSWRQGDKERIDRLNGKIKALEKETEKLENENRELAANNEKLQEGNFDLTGGLQETSRQTQSMAVKYRRTSKK